TDARTQWLHTALDKIAAEGKIDVSVDAETSTETGVVNANTTFVPLVGVEGESLGYMLAIEDISTEKRVKSTMARYMTKEVADRLLAGGQDALGGQSQIASVLFSDIRSFTTIS